jgi:hypothetical protein
MDFKNLCCQMFVIVKKNSRTLGKENHRLDLALKNLLKICRLAYWILFLCDFHL